MRLDEARVNSKSYAVLWLVSRFFLVINPLSPRSSRV